MRRTGSTPGHSSVLTALSAYSQEYIFGKVKSEFGNELFETVVINTRNDEKVLTDKDGNYMIYAKPTDQLRFVKSGYERTDVKITIQNYSSSLNVSLKETNLSNVQTKYLLPFLKSNNSSFDLFSNNLFKTLIAYSLSFKQSV